MHKYLYNTKEEVLLNGKQVSKQMHMLVRVAGLRAF